MFQSCSTTLSAKHAPLTMKALVTRHLFKCLPLSSPSCQHCLSMFIFQFLKPAKFILILGQVRGETGKGLSHVLNIVYNFLPVLCIAFSFHTSGLYLNIIKSKRPSLTTLLPAISLFLSNTHRGTHTCTYPHMCVHMHTYEHICLHIHIYHRDTHAYIPYMHAHRYNCLHHPHSYVQ